MSEPFFSVITPVYNREEIVVETILSVLKQSDGDFEYILVNDASADNSLDVLHAFSKQDSRIRVIDLEENSGRCFARNKGLQEARGNWICYLDSDDIFYENHLSTMRASINLKPEIRVFATDQHINGKLKHYRRSKLHEDGILLELNDFIEDNPLTGNQICHARNNTIAWSDERIPISEDWLFTRSIAINYPIFKRAIPTSNLREHDQRSMNTVDAQSFVKHNLHAAEKFISENDLSPSLRRRIQSYTLILCTNVFLKNRQKKEAFKLFRKALKMGKTYTYLLFYKAILKFFL